MNKNFLKNYIIQFKRMLDNINIDDFDTFISALKLAYQKDRQIFVFGNGGSGSNASHFAADMNKGVIYEKDKRFKVICLNDNMPIILSYANDVSYDEIFVCQLKNFINKDDLVIGISGSGNSSNVVKAIDFSNKYGAKTFGICGFGGGKLKNIAQKSIVIESFDMQKVEDLHMILFHCVMQFFNNRFKAGQGVSTEFNLVVK